MPPFNVVPKAASPASASAAPSPAESSRARAIAMMSRPPAPAAAAPNAQEAPVINPSAVSPEEMSAIVAPSKKAEEDEETEKVEGANASEVQPDTTETPASEAKPEETPAKPEDPLSSQYAILARKEKALRAKAQSQEQAYKAREAAMAAREEAIKAKEAEFQTGYIAKSRLNEDALGVLAEAGISYDQLTEKALSQQTQDPATRAALKRLEDQVAEQRKVIEDSQKRNEDAQKSQYSNAINQIRNDVTALVKTSDDFEVVRETQSIGDVVELIEKTFHEGLGDDYPKGTILDVETAARMVEEHLVEEAAKLYRLKKLQSKYGQKPAAAPAVPKTEMKPAATPEAPKASAAPAKTLTNQMSTQRKLTAKERAILAFKGENRS